MPTLADVPHAQPRGVVDRGGMVMLGVMVALGTAILSAFAPALGAIFAVVGILSLWRCAAKPVPAGPIPRQRLSRLAFGSTLVGTVSIGFSASTGLLTPSAGLVGVLLGLVAARLIRRRPDELHGQVFCYAGIALGLAQVFVFALHFDESRGTLFRQAA